MRRRRPLIALVLIFAFCLFLAQAHQSFPRTSQKQSLTELVCRTGDIPLFIDNLGRTGGVVRTTSFPRGFVVDTRGDAIVRHDVPFACADNCKQILIGRAKIEGKLQPAIMTPTDKLRALTHLPQNAIPLGVNRTGQIVGIVAQTSGDLSGFLADSVDTFQLLSEVTNEKTTSCRSINDKGALVGSVLKNQQTQGFYWRPGRALLMLHPKGADSSVATGINNRDQVVGYALFDGVSKPFLWSLETGIQVWNDSPPSDAGESVVTTNALDINDSGEILFGGIQNRKTVYFVFRPEPNSRRPHCTQNSNIYSRQKHCRRKRR